MTEYDYRAERAFRSALSSHADGFEPSPLHLSDSPRPKRVRAWGAVAAAAVLMAGTAVGITMIREQQPQLPAGQTEPPPPDAGWRYESYGDVVVQVPDSWGYGAAPKADWCAEVGVSLENRYPHEPFVANNSTSGVLDILCGGGAPNPLGMEAPERLWTTHLSLGVSSDQPIPDGVEKYDGWTRIVTSVGHVRISVLADQEHLADAHRIVDSAKVVDRDHLGCDARSPVQVGHFPSPPKPFDLAQVAEVESIAICQYGLNGPDGDPGLLASRQLTGAAAQRQLDALKAAPVGSGPNTPETCLNSMTGDTAIVLRLDTGPETRDVYGYTDWCINNGFDDGTAVRALTRANCLPLWGDRVIMWGGSSAPFAMCHE